MRKTIFAALMISFVFGTAGLTYAQRFNAQQGDKWLGGSFGFSSVGLDPDGYSGDIDRVNTVILSPVIRFFPANNLTFGPKISWTGNFVGDGNVNFIGLGGEIGYVGSSPTIPYFLISPHAGIIAQTDYDSETMFMLPFTLGIMSPVGGNLGLQFEIGYSLGFHEDININAFYVGLGLCGFGEKLALSMVNVLGSANPLN